jgi:dTMP kinase
MSGYNVTRTHEPGSMIEPYIRELFKRASGPPSPDEMTVMFTADRLVHMETSVRPALDLGFAVISDRHKLSTLVYQTVNGADPELIEKLVSIPQPQPDLTIILDLKPEIARARLQARNPELDSYERNLEKQTRMRQLYLEHRNRFGRSYVIDAEQSFDHVVVDALVVIKAEIDDKLDDRMLSELETKHEL